MCKPRPLEDTLTKLLKQRIILIGFGNVGQGLAEILLEKSAALREQYDCEFEITGVADIARGTVYNPRGLDIPTLLAEAAPGKQFSTSLRPWDSLTLIREAQADVMCELSFTDLKTGEPAISHCRAALESGKSVAASNKGPAALAYRELLALAREKNLSFRIEGTVMSGTPVLNLYDGPLAGCAVNAVVGILNGTTNYILTRMEEGLDYGAALTKAQELGYAEADPTGDVEGYDARGKVAILANVVMGAALKIDDIPCTGITSITSEDISAARRENCRWKLIGSINTTNGAVTAAVAPQKIPLTHPLASVMGAVNAITFSTDLLGDVSIIGPGAGRRKTGFAILSDLLNIRQHRN